MRSLYRLCALISVSAVVLAGCSGGESQRPTITTTVIVDSTEGPSKGGDAAQAASGKTDGATSTGPQAMYATVFADPSAIPVNSAARYSPKGTYSYAFVEATGDDKPEMLLRVDSAEFSPVIVLTTDSKGAVVPSEEVLIAGAASVGGTRAAVAASASGNGVYQIDSRSLSRNANSQRFLLDGGHLVPDSQEEFNVEVPLVDHQEVEWLTMDGAPAGGNAPAAGGESEAAPATAPGQLTVTGRVEVRTAQELMAGRKMPNQSDNPTDEYVVLVLDQPVTVSGMGGGMARTETVSELSLGPASTNRFARAKTYDHLDSQSVTVVFDAQKVSFPSDVSLPLGMPRVGDVITSIG